MAHGIGPLRRGRLWLYLLIAAGAGVAAGLARADSLDLGGNTELSYKLVLDYGVAIRTRNPSQALINGPIDPLLIDASATAFKNGTSFSHTGLSTTINFDDGDRNFRKGSLNNNRISTDAEAQLTHENYGVVVSGDYFYDQVYHHPNDNTSADTVNHFGDPNKFTTGAVYYDGQRPRLLEAYGYGDWNLGGDTALDLRVGKQLVAYGEALFFSGIALAQGPADATKSVIPGAEVKDILLPVDQVSFQLSATKDLSVLGYYHLDYKADEIFPVGDYYSVQDAVGPGAQFAYGSINPLYTNGCAGLLTNIELPLGQNLYNTLISGLGKLGLNLDSLCNLNGALGPAWAPRRTSCRCMGPPSIPAVGASTAWA